ncbi:MAG: hypothetical protein HN849_20065 [Victivallales bacterium]|jgi:hypothetical protein|nr:hypothetical protein [Victivallales bacterium]
MRTLSHVVFLGAATAAVSFGLLAHAADKEEGAKEIPPRKPIQMSNSIGQELFEAHLTTISTTRHRRFKWAMTFRRFHDSKEVSFVVWDSHPLPCALGFKRWKDASEGVEGRIAKAPRVLLISRNRSASQTGDYYGPEIRGPGNSRGVLDGWMVIEKKTDAGPATAADGEDAAAE